MIPSRALSLFEIIGETFAIYGKTVTRYLALALLLIVPGIALMTYGVASFSEDAVLAAKHDIDFSDNDLTAARDQFNVWLARNNPMLATDDTAKPKADSTVATDSLARTTTAPTRAGDAHQILYYLRTNTSKFSGPISFALAGGWLLLIGLFVLVSAIIDLACQAFEEREWEVTGALREAIAKNGWKILALYLLYTVLSTLINQLLVAMEGVSASVAGALSAIITIGQIYFLVRSIASFPAIVSEEAGPIAGMRRSWLLTHRQGPRIVLLGIAASIIFFFVALIVSMITGMAFGSTWAWWHSFSTNSHLTVSWFADTLPGFIWGAVVDLTLTAIVFLPLAPILLTVLYYDLRTRLEGALVYME